jgi:hypothetical protein
MNTSVKYSSVAIGIQVMKKTNLDRYLEEQLHRGKTLGSELTAA